MRLYSYQKMQYFLIDAFILGIRLLFNKEGLILKKIIKF
ncbi:hypothetical protein EU96_1732 [Prochlorococcus marinus str. MIT 9302]|uniref:Uncharacterized protein n=1 Tax=Prochlorococcus marinus str. MIT 9302 TaxID=74545 RepID=A0A0A2A8G8_PROMR|nr:hypothetical protein EU96_1732 [Prochlorococcus marinus str. MIT 9302]